MKNSTTSNKIQFKTIRYLVSFILTISFLWLNTNCIYAQGFCSNTETSSPSSNYNSSFQNMNANGPFYIKIYIHVIRNANGIGGQSLQSVKDAVNILQQDFNPHNIYFVWDCSIDYIDNNIWFQGPVVNGSSTGIYNVNNNYNGIDIYLFPDIANSNGGRANGVGGSSEFWVAGVFSGLPVSTSHIISHEMGHCINLWHTHHGCESGIWENTNGSNCAVAGDYVCDTPSDPHLGFNVNTITCNWSGQALCPTPEPVGNYNPDTRIIMAYTQPNCMAYFTNGQGQRMRNSIASLPYLQTTQTIPSTNVCFCFNNLTFITPLSGFVDQEVSNWIEGRFNNIILPGANVTYDAGNQVRLKPGFKALQGSRFHAFIDGCGGNRKISSDENQHLASIKNEMELNIYPNPTSHTANVSYTLLNKDEISIDIFDATGKMVTTLAKNQSQPAGKHQLELNATNLPTGIYYLKLQSNEMHIIKKLMITK